MLLNLSDVLTVEGKVEQHEIPLEMSVFSNRVDTFEILEKSPIALAFTNVGEGEARVEGSCKLKLSAICDRCLAEAQVDLELAIDRIIVSPEAVTEDEETVEESRNLMDGFQLDVDALVHNEIVVNWPVKILCREDCKGVCPVCGQNLNERECGCDTFVPDPRMAAIKDIFNANIFNANKEV